jgi:hypothetical protein
MDGIVARHAIFHPDPSSDRLGAGGIVQTRIRSPSSTRTLLAAQT